jgi:hypothetical protein
MAVKLRRVLTAARFQASRPDQPTPEEINVIRLALGSPRGITAKVEALWEAPEKIGWFFDDPNTLGIRQTCA